MRLSSFLCFSARVDPVQFSLVRRFTIAPVVGRAPSHVGSRHPGGRIGRGVSQPPPCHPTPPPPPPRQFTIENNDFFNQHYLHFMTAKLRSLEYRTRVQSPESVEVSWPELRGPERGHFVSGPILNQGPDSQNSLKLRRAGALRRPAVFPLY